MRPEQAAQPAGPHARVMDRLDLAEVGQGCLESRDLAREVVPQVRANSAYPGTDTSTSTSTSPATATGRANAANGTHRHTPQNPKMPL